MIKSFITFFLSLVSQALIGAPDPYVIEAKVQQDLENSLSRLIPHEQFVVQVSADVRMDTERRLVEGENVATAIPRDPEDIPPPPMPGFVPEATVRPPMMPQQTRQVYKTIETPVLNTLRVHASFDDQLPLATVTKGRLVVTTYLNTNYPGKSAITFGQMPMLKVDKKKEMKEEHEDLMKKLTDWDKKREKPAPTLEEQAWKYGRWSALLLLVLTVFVQFLRPQLAKMQHVYSGAGGLSTGNSSRQSKNSNKSVSAPSPVKMNGIAESKRKNLLDRFLIRSEAFRSYYDRLSNQDRAELHGAIGGPGYDRLIEGLGFNIPAESHEPGNLEEFLSIHEKNFDEMVKALDWQDRQFFGFLHQLSKDHILSLSQYVSPRGLAMMLRFMKPHQSANVLDSLPGARRVEVLSAMQNIVHAPLSERHEIEREVRDIVAQLPLNNFGTEKENLNFWGGVISESSHQDELLDAIEKTNPQIYKDVKKFKFSLEDIASLPSKTIESVLNDVDNSELGQALATCRSDIVDIILESVSQKRRNILLSQIASYKRVPREALSSARASLTRKFREAIA